MLIATESVEIPTAGGLMPAYLARPKGEGRFPGVVFFSDIFQLTEPMLRITRRLAGYGFAVLAPEIYYRAEGIDSSLDFEDDRALAMDCASRFPTADFDADLVAALDFLEAHPAVDPARRFAAGFCFGGHLAFRAALRPEVKATACFYPTGLHNNKLGLDPAESLARAGEIRGKLLMVFGTLDPHIPEDARAKIAEALKRSGVDHQTLLYPAEHTFMREEGTRHDPEATDQAFAAMIELFRGI